MCTETYYQEQRIRVRKLYNSAKHHPFGGRDRLADWFVRKLKEQHCECHYCETSIHDINALIDSGKLRTRAVRGGGRRGPVLEIDKQDDGYNEIGCVLACYYCNNDKSYTATAEEYKEYFGANRGSFFRQLLDTL